jgi:hypothetical protein
LERPSAIRSATLLTDLGDRGELFQIVRQVREQRRVDRRIADRHERERVAVGRRFRDRRHRNVAGGADAVLDDHALIPALRQPVGNDARESVRRAAGREADDDVDRPCGIIRVVGGARCRCGCERHERACQKSCENCHRLPLGWSAVVR